MCDRRTKVNSGETGCAGRARCPRVSPPTRTLDSSSPNVWRIVPHRACLRPSRVSLTAAPAPWRRHQAGATLLTPGSKSEPRQPPSASAPASRRLLLGDMFTRGHWRLMEPAPLPEVGVGLHPAVPRRAPRVPGSGHLTDTHPRRLCAPLA